MAISCFGCAKASVALGNKDVMESSFFLKKQVQQFMILCLISMEWFNDIKKHVHLVRQ